MSETHERSTGLGAAKASSDPADVRSCFDLAVSAAAAGRLARLAPGATLSINDRDFSSSDVEEFLHSLEQLLWCERLGAIVVSGRSAAAQLRLSARRAGVEVTWTAVVDATFDDDGRVLRADILADEGAHQWPWGRTYRGEGGQRPAVGLSHSGICVADVERAQRFYENVFGFEETYRAHVVGDGMGRLMAVDEFSVNIRILALGGRKIELVEYDQVPAHPHCGHPVNTIGFTHIAFYVDDVDEGCSRVTEFGGRVLTDQRLALETDTERRQYQFCVDPDGNRVELIQGSVRG